MAHPTQGPSRRRVATALLAGLGVWGLGGCAPDNRRLAPTRTVLTVRGTLSWRERLALPPDAEVIVRLQDVSRADAPAVVLAEQRIRTADRQRPYEFALDVDAQRIDPRMRYTVAARVEQAGRLLSITDTAYPVLTQGAPQRVDMVLVRVAR